MKKLIILIVAAAAITLMIPQRVVSPFSIYMGQVWYADAVFAPFDIALEKSGTQIKTERDAIQSSFLPVYRLDSVVANKRSATLTSILASNNSIGTTQKSAAIDTLHRAYLTGILSNTDYNTTHGKELRRVDGVEIEAVHNGDLFSVAQVINILTDITHLPEQLIGSVVAANLSYDERLSEALKREALSSISSVEGMVRKGDKIIDWGEVVTSDKFTVLNSMIEQYETRIDTMGSPLYSRAAQFLIVFSLLMLNYLFFTQFSQNYFGRGLREVLFVLLLYVMMSALMSVVARIDQVPPYVVPLPVVAVYCLAFFNMRVAILANLSVSFLVAMFVRQPFDFFAVNVMTGMVAILMMRHNYHRGFLLRAVGVILLCSMLIYTCFALMREGNFESINFETYLWLAVNSILFLGFYQAIYVLERMFGFVSDITLLELCDTNQPLLLELAHNAPGTFQHSVQVANLAESAAKEIGANALLCRTGALYHDIGKMSNPFYFVENLTGVFNPHDDSTPTESARIVKAHVTDGVATARKHKLPARVVDFIRSHHGKSLIYYFWVEAQKSGTEVNKEDFRYEGPLPVSREVSICMMADAVEAASRSLPSYDKEPLEELVDRIIDTQIAEGQMVDSELSFQEIARIKAVFKAKLSNIYHGRIAYPVRVKN